MADNPYTPPTLNGYNLNPPSNAGAETVENKLDWDGKHIAKIGDPLKNYGDDQNTATQSAFGQTINTGSDQNNAMGGSLAFTASEVTIATFTITATRSHHTVDTEGDAATDILKTINTGSVSDGCILYLRQENPGRVVTVQSSTGAGENIFLAGGIDFVLDAAEKTLTLQRVGTNWQEISRPISLASLGVDPLSLAKAWVVFSYSAGVPQIDSSFNVTSLSDDGTGLVGITFTNALNDTDYGIQVTAFANGAGAQGKGTGTKATTSCQVQMGSGASYGDADVDGFVTIFGN